MFGCKPDITPNTIDEFLKNSDDLEENYENLIRHFNDYKNFENLQDLKDVLNIINGIFFYCLKSILL